MTASTRNWPPVEAEGQPRGNASLVGHHAVQVSTPYPTQAWQTWPEVEITVNPGLAEDPCEYCGYLDRLTVARVHAPVWFGFKDVCDVCLPEVVQMAVDLNPETTQVETAS